MEPFLGLVNFPYRLKCPKDGPVLGRSGRGKNSAHRVWEIVMDFPSRNLNKTVCPGKGIAKTKSCRGGHLAAENNFKWVLENASACQPEEPTSIPVRQIKEVLFSPHDPEALVIVPKADWSRPEHAGITTNPLVFPEVYIPGR